MTRLSGVTIDGEDSASARARSTLAVMPSTVRVARATLALLSSVIDSSRLRAMTGSMTLSSKEPVVPAKAIVASLPMTCAQTIATASGITRSEEHTSELQSRGQLVCRLLREKNNKDVRQ